MEPMNLGSPPSSPSSPGTNPNYLPAFLMGDKQRSTPNPSSSPEQSRNYSYTISSPPEPGNLRHRLFSPGSMEPSIVASPTLDVSIDKPGPPKQSLFDTIDTKSPSTPAFSARDNFLAESSAVQDLSRSASYNQILLDTNRPLCRTDSFSNMDVIKNDTNPNLWVTVFGFPANCASMVLARFASCGTIVEKRFPAQGNWAHLKFSSPHETAKALALNGKLISKNIMVGVVPYHQKEANKENANVSLYTSPIRVRPLRHSFASPQNDNAVLPPLNVPQKSTGLVTKAMEYVFGW